MDVLDVALENFIRQFPTKQRREVIDVFFKNVEDIIDWSLQRMSPPDAIKFVQQRPSMFFGDVDPTKVPWDSNHLMDLYVDLVCDSLKDMKLH
jgi:hypothetical protein